MFIIRIITIAALIAGGIVAAAPMLAKKFEWTKQLSENLQKFDGIIGLILIVIGILKIFVPEGTTSWVYPMTRQLFIGDLLPMLASLLLGVVLAGGIIGKFIGKDKEGKIKSFADSFRVPAGIAGIVVGILHNFLFYYIIF